MHCLRVHEGGGSQHLTLSLTGPTVRAFLRLTDVGTGPHVVTQLSKGRPWVQTQTV